MKRLLSVLEHALSTWKISYKGNVFCSLHNFFLIAANYFTNAY